MKKENNNNSPQVDAEHLKPVPRRLVSSGSKPLSDRLVKEKRLWCFVEDNLRVYRKLERASRQLGNMAPATRQIGRVFIKVREAQDMTENIIRSLRALLREDNAGD